MTEDIQLDKIRTDGGTQARSGLDETTVQEYADAMMEHKGWGDFPPVIVFYDGSDYWLADGFHRLAAFQRNWGSLHRGKNILEVEVRQGTQRDAVLHAAGANNSHGLRRSAADKWRAVERLLVDPEWGTWSDREIARRCHVSPTFVGRVRGTLGRIDRPYHAPPPLPLPVHVDSDDSQRTYTRAGQTAVMNTDQIGQRKAKRGGLTKAEYTQVLVPDLVEFLRTYTDKHGRGWRQMQSVAAHTNSTPWQDITREWKRRQIYYEDETLKDAIKLAFGVLNGEQTAELEKSIEAAETAVSETYCKWWKCPSNGKRFTVPGDTMTCTVCGAKHAKSITGRRLAPGEQERLEQPPKQTAVQEFAASRGLVADLYGYADPRQIRLKVAILAIEELVADKSLGIAVVGPLARALQPLDEANKALAQLERETAVSQEAQS